MREKVFFTGSVGKCDACSRPLADEFGFGDVALRGADDLWGLLCLPCYAVEGVRWKWGRGQRTCGGQMGERSCCIGARAALIQASLVQPHTPCACLKRITVAREVFSARATAATASPLARRCSASASCASVSARGLPSTLPSLLARANPA